MNWISSIDRIKALCSVIEFSVAHRNVTLCHRDKWYGALFAPQMWRINRITEKVCLMASGKNSARTGFVVCCYCSNESLVFNTNNIWLRLCITANTFSVSFPGTCNWSLNVYPLQVTHIQLNSSPIRWMIDIVHTYRAIWMNNKSDGVSLLYIDWQTNVTFALCLSMPFSHFHGQTHIYPSNMSFHCFGSKPH